jgi:hypothetical protein
MREAHSIEVSAADREEMVVAAGRNSPQKHGGRVRIILVTAEAGKRRRSQAMRRRDPLHRAQRHTVAHRHCPPTTSLRRAVADESDTSSPNRSRQRRRVSLGDSQHLRRFLSLLPIEQRVPHSSNSSQHSCPTLPAPLSSSSETDSSRATKSGQSTSKIPILYRCASASLEHRFVS